MGFYSLYIDYHNRLEDLKHRKQKGGKVDALIETLERTRGDAARMAYKQLTKRERKQADLLIQSVKMFGGYLSEQHKI